MADFQPPIFDLPAITELAVNTDGGSVLLSATSWLVLQAAVSLIKNLDFWGGEYGKGVDGLTASEIEEITLITEQLEGEIVAPE